MTGIRCWLALGASVLLTGNASAQFFPLPIVGMPVIVPNGIDFQFNSRRLQVGGFIATGGATTAIVPVSPFGFFPRVVGPVFYYPYSTMPIYGAVDTRFTLQVINPTVVVQAQRSAGPSPQDLAGIDLDEEPASKIWGERKANVKLAGIRKGEAIPIAPVAERKIEAKVAPPVPPRKEVIPEDERQIANGITAFRNGDYGIALLRFRNLTEAEPPIKRALFLQGQTYLAVGKYREAAQLIQRALKLQPEWVQGGYRPKVELYANNAERWKQHRERLEQVQQQQPKNADYLFLLGYLAWFDGEREAAVAYFRQARILAADPQWNDLFLQAAKVAVK